MLKVFWPTASPSSSFRRKRLMSLFALTLINSLQTHTHTPLAPARVFGHFIRAAQMEKMSCPFLDNDVLVFLFFFIFFTLIWSNVLSARQICFGPISWIVMATGRTAVTAPVIPYLFPLLHHCFTSSCDANKHHGKDSANRRKYFH